MTPSKVILSLIFAATLGAGCGSDSTSSPVLTTTASPVAASSRTAGPANYCLLAAEMGRPPTFDDLLSATGSTNSAKNAAAALRQSVTSTRALAPTELAADFVTLANSYDRYFALLAKSGWNVGDMVRAVADPMSATAVAYGKIDTATADQAATRIVAYNRTACAPNA